MNNPCAGAVGEPCPHRAPAVTRTGPRSPWLCATCRRRVRDARRRSGALKRLERVYGLSGADLGVLRASLPLNARGVPVCPGCHQATGAVKALAVDHDHTLERAGLPIRETVRGLLCGPCNQLVGRYGVQALERLIDYLKDPPAFRVLGTHDRD